MKSGRVDEALNALQRAFVLNLPEATRARFNADRESLALSQDPEFLKLVARSRADFSEGWTISRAEMKGRVLGTTSPDKRIQQTARKAPRG